MLLLDNSAWLKKRLGLPLVAVVCVTILYLCSMPAIADEASSPSWLDDNLQFHIFGTLGASYHDEKGLEYRRNIEQRNGVSANQLDFSSDSLLGGQLDLQINELFSASTQVVSRNNAKGNWKPEPITGFLRYQPSEMIQIRLGRIPTYSNVGAETRFASYAYTEVRPSPELYGLFSPIDRYDGVSIEYTTPIATGIGKVILNYGSSVGDLFINNHFDIDDTSNTGVGLSWQKDNLELRGLYTHERISNDNSLAALGQALAATPFPTAQQRGAEIISTENYTREIYGAAVAYTPGEWEIKVVAGGGRQGGSSKIKAEAGSILIGYNLGQFTPYAIAAYNRTRTNIKPSGVLNLTPQLTQLNALYTDALTASKAEQDTLSLGVRYDFAKNYALKFQVDKINAETTPYTLSTRTESADKDLTLFTIALDFLF